MQTLLFATTVCLIFASSLCNGAVKTMYADPDLIIEAIDHPDSTLLGNLTFTGVDVNVPNSDGIVPIIMAAVKGDLKRIQILVEAGADLNVREADDWTPLMFVASEGWLDIAKYMLYMGASPFYRNSNGMSAYDVAKLRHHQELAYLLANVELLMALDEAHTEGIVRALDHGADHSLANGNGFTALLHMCSAGEHEIVMHLISNTADDYTHKEKDGWSCITFAASRGEVETLRFLLSLPNISTADLELARKQARESRQYQAVQMLTQHISHLRQQQQLQLQQQQVQVQVQEQEEGVPQFHHSRGQAAATVELVELSLASTGSISINTSNSNNNDAAPSAHTTAAAVADAKLSTVATSFSPRSSGSSRATSGASAVPRSASTVARAAANGHFNIKNHEVQQKYHF